MGGIADKNSKSMKKVIIFFSFFMILIHTVFAQSYSSETEGSQVELYTAKQQQLRITAENVRLIPDKENGGYHLYVKKTANVNSILLTETTKDPAGKNDSVLVTIITDGEENCSQEYNLKLVKNLIEKQKQQGWTFTLIGTDNLDVEGMAGSLSIDNHLAFTEDAPSTAKMFAKERKARARFYASVACGKTMEAGEYFKED